MASSIQEIAFLDLTDIDDAERDHLHQVLYTIPPNLELPWEVQNERHCSSHEFEPTPFALASIPHPTLRGVFLPQPLYTTAPAAVAVGLVPSVTAAESPNGPAVGLIPSVDSLECNPESIVASTSPPAVSQVQSHGSGTGESGFPTDNTPVQMLSIPPSVSTSVPPSSQPVITTMYQMVGPAGMAPLSNVYVGNVTANVNVHSFVGPPLTPYSHISQQVFSPGEVSVPHESAGSPNAGRNSLGQRRPRNPKPSSKRVEGQFGPRTPGVGHGHEVLAPAVVESPTGPPPPLPQNYMIPVPSMHHAHPFHQPFYPSPTQPPHGTPHLPQHPSAPHATGTPLFVPLFHAPMYNTYHHQPAAGGPIVYSASPAIAPAPVATSEQSSGISYQVNEGPSERMVPEGRETEVSVHDPQNLYGNEEVSPLKGPVTEGEKISSYLHQDSSDAESCTLASTVVVNNSNIVTSSQFSDSEMPNCSEVPEHNMKGEDTSNEYVSGKGYNADQASHSDSSNVNELPQVTSNVNKCLINEVMDTPVEKKENLASALPITPKLASTEKSQSDLKSNGPSATKQSSDSLLTNSAQKAVASNSSPFTRPSVASDMTPTAPVSVNPREKTWASLFDKSSGNSLPSDGAMIIATGMTPSNAATKPLAAVRPFQNAVTVSSGSSDGSRKTSDTTSVSGDGAKHFSQLNQSDLPAPSLADDPLLYRLGEFLSKYQLDHRAISLQPRGLTNRSNWCYINSTLQALLACPPFYNLMKSLSMPPRRSGKSSTPIIESMVEFVNEFSPLSPVSRVNRKEKAQRKDDTIEVQVGAAFEPSYIYKMLSNIQSDTFKVEGRQEDAEEFFSCLLNALNDEMLELIKLVKDTSESNISNGDVSNGDGSNQGYDEDDTEWKVMGRKNKGSVTRRAEFERTPVSDIFRGQLRSRVQRTGDYSDNVQPFFTLQLDIEKAQSVKEALDLLVGRDQLEGVTCSRTNQEVEAWQQVTLEELPLVLVLHLKWFNYKLDGCSKIVKTVDFPIDLKFDGKLMSSYNKYTMKQKQYKLFAVVYHDGKEATKGHYITDVYHVGYGGWVRYDDSSVKAIQETQMLHPRGSRVPYLLYYRRCDTIGSAAATPDKSR